MLRRLAICLLALSLLGCGYGFRGTVSYLPGDIQTIAITYPIDKAGEPDLTDILAQALIQEFNRTKLLKLVAPARADVILRGTIKSVSSGAVAFEDVRTALERRVTMVVDMELVRRTNDQLVWRQRGLAEGEDYNVDSVSSVTEDNRQEALAEAAERLAMRIHDSIFENF